MTASNRTAYQKPRLSHAISIVRGEGALIKTYKIAESSRKNNVTLKRERIHTNQIFKIGDQLSHSAKESMPVSDSPHRKLKGWISLPIFSRDTFDLVENYFLDIHGRVCKPAIV